MLAAVVLALPASAGAAVEPVGDQAAAMYSPAAVDVVYLTLSPTEKSKLEAAPETYVKGTFSLANSDGTPGGVGVPSAPLPVEIRLKGQIGSFRDLNHKAAFKLKFKKTERFLGLRKMTLNNMVQDASMIHEAMSYAAFRAAGVPASRTGYAYVYLNGVDYGLHLNIENLDEVALEKRFGAFQHLYEGEYGEDVVPGGAGAFEIDEGDEADRSDLEALIAAIDGDEPAGFSARVEPRVDLVEMTRMWAVEHYVGHWDGYITKNNYYLFSDPQGRFQMFPWGTDQTWDEHHFFGHGDGILFAECIADESCRALYMKSLRQARIAIESLGLSAFATSEAALLLPWQELEEDNSRREHLPPEIAAAVQEARDYIASRPTDLDAYLKAQPAERFATNVAVALAPASVPADGVTPSLATATVTDGDGALERGDRVVFAVGDVYLGPGAENADGTYSLTIPAGTNAGLETITATDTWPTPNVSGSTGLRRTPTAAARISLALGAAALPADGTSTTTATATLLDAYGNRVEGGGARVTFLAGARDDRVGPVVDHGDGTYSATITVGRGVGTFGVEASFETAAGTIVSARRDFEHLEYSPPRAAPAPYVAPRASILVKPAARTRRHRVTFTFASDRSGATFRCRLGDRGYKACASPFTIRALAPGRHVFSVVAVDPSGAPGPPETYRFTVVPKKRHR